MLLTERPHGIEPLATVAGEVCLRLTGDDDRERVVPLPAGKSTIGSSPRCTLRIARPGVAPVHCLIVAAGGRLSVRRWASDALLNGMPFDDAALVVGDRLTVGPVDLQVQAAGDDGPADRLTDRQRTDEPAAPDHAAEQDVEDHRDAAANTSSADLPAAPAEMRNDRMEESAAEVVFQRLRTGRTLARERNRKLLAALRRQQEAYTTLAERVEHLARQVQAMLGENEGLRGELDEARQALTATEERLGSLDALAEQRDHLAAEHQRLAEEHARLAEENTRVAAERAALADEMDHARGERQQAVEALERFEQQYEERQVEFARERAEWDELRGGWQSRLEGHVSRIEHLQRELEQLREDPPAPSALDAESAAAQPETGGPAEPAIEASGDTGSGDVEPSVEGPREQPSESNSDGGWRTSSDAESSAPPAELPVAWPTAGQPVAGEGDEDVVDGAGEAHGPSQSDPSDAWDSGDWAGVVGAGERTEPEGDEPGQASEEAAAESLELPDEMDGPGEPAPPTESPTGEPQADRNGSSDSGTGSSLRDSELAAVREFSLWNQGPEHDPEESSDAVDAVDAVADDANATAAVAGQAAEPEVDDLEASAAEQTAEASPPEPSPRRVKTPSYIERYAHLFDDDAEADAEPVPAAAEVAVSTAPDPLGTATMTDPDADHEESIEEYMAKLMKRTRGQSTTGLPPTESAPPTSARGGQAQPTTAADKTEHDRPLESLAEMTSSGRPEPSSNLTALRSLANDIARQAIGTYAARKYRRTAVTQIIIAMLAGMTSLYLMLLAPSWHDVQFVSACVSLGASGYYLLLTITTLIDSVRASVFEELEQDLTEVDPWHPPLPIDVERGEGEGEMGRQGDKEMGRQGDKEMGRQGEGEAR